LEFAARILSMGYYVTKWCKNFIYGILCD